MNEKPHPASSNAPDPPDGIAVEPAAPEDRLDVLRVVDAAMLDVDTDGLSDRIAADDVHVARAERTGAVVGAVVIGRPTPARRRVEAVAVRRERRARGIGSALVAEAVRVAAADPAVERVTAAFDPSLSTFYADLGFTIEREATGDGPTGVDDGGSSDRLRGVLETGND